MTSAVLQGAVHVVCCDANLALCGALVPGTQYVEDAASCVLCALADELGKPCSAPGCDVGRDQTEALLDFALSGCCRVCGCTDDDACPDGCRWVNDPAGLGALCSGCLPAVTGSSDADKGQETGSP